MLVKIIARKDEVKDMRKFIAKLSRVFGKVEIIWGRVADDMPYEVTFKNAHVYICVRDY